MFFPLHIRPEVERAFSPQAEPQKLQLKVARIFTELFEGWNTEVVQRRNGSVPREPAICNGTATAIGGGEQNNLYGYTRIPNLISLLGSISHFC